MHFRIRPARLAADLWNPTSHFISAIRDQTYLRVITEEIVMLQLWIQMSGCTEID